MDKIKDILKLLILVVFIGIIVFIIIFINKYNYYKEVEIHKFANYDSKGNARYTLVQDYKYDYDKFKIYLAMLNLKKNNEISEDFKCSYLVLFNNGTESICYDGGDYALYTKIEDDKLLESKNKALEFFTLDPLDKEKITTTNKVIRINNKLKELINDIEI